MDREAEGLRILNSSRDQILARLWVLANFNRKLSRGSMAGPIKVLAVIVAIAGLIPDRHLYPAQPAVTNLSTAKRISGDTRVCAAIPAACSFLKLDRKRLLGSFDGASVRG